MGFKQQKDITRAGREKRKKKIEKKEKYQQSIQTDAEGIC
jgi:hypothetical protein